MINIEVHEISFIKVTLSFLLFLNTHNSGGRSVHSIPKNQMLYLAEENFNSNLIYSCQGVFPPSDECTRFLL